LEIRGRGIHNPHGGGNTYELERALDQDMLLTSVGWANSYYMDDEAYEDEWGVGWGVQAYETPFGVGHYTEIIGHPLADNSAIPHYQAPDPKRPELYTDAAHLVANYRDEYWIVGVTVTTILETAWALRGLEQLLVDLAVDPDLANHLLDIPYRYHLIAAKELVRLGVDMIWTGDDIGSQLDMMISPKMWRRYLKPRMANYISELKAINPDIKIAYHSDGNILRIIPELIEIGVDVLNPIQPASMNPSQIKEAFGDRLCFWGSIDEQHTLPFGSKSDVEVEVRQRLQTIGREGGLILAPTHHVQLDTPLENFWSMVNTITSTPYSTLN
jgi:uroporphyrinogen decarboxylase